LSLGLEDTFAPIMTIIDVIASDKVCHASAIIAIEFVNNPINNLNTNKIMLINIDNQPSIYDSFLFINSSLFYN